MARPGRPKGSKNTFIAAPEAVHGKENEQATVDAVIEQESPEIPSSEERAPFNTMRYHADLEPRLFREGEIIPAGWSDKRHASWSFDDRTGKWSKGE